MNIRKPALMERGLLAMLIWGSLSGPAIAWTHLYTTTYLLGDNDSRLTARQHAVSRIQQQAAQESGTYIQGSTRLVNDALDEQISRESAAIVQVEVLFERYDMTASGQLQLSLQARANVDDSVLRDRVQAARTATPPQSAEEILPENTGRQRAAVVERSLPQLTEIREQQQQLAQQNRQLREQLETLARQPARLATGSLAAVALAGEPGWLEPLLSSLQALPVHARIISRAPQTAGDLLALGVQTEWRLSLAKDSPLDRLCREWQCVAGYAYRGNSDDLAPPPLHQQLYRPISRPARMEDKLLSHWQLLTLQAVPPKPLTADETQALQSRVMSRPLYVQTRLADQTWLLPLMTWSPALGGLVISLQGTTAETGTPVYDGVTGNGRYLCTPAYKGGQCHDRLPVQFALQEVKVSHAVLKRSPVLEAKVVVP